MPQNDQTSVVRVHTNVSQESRVIAPLETQQVNPSHTGPPRPSPFVETDYPSQPDTSLEIDKVTQQSSLPSAQSSKEYTIADLENARPPTFMARLQRFFFIHGLADRPDFMQRIYRQIPRKVVVNCPLPVDMKHEPLGKCIIHYPANKIRTTKYTPLSFLPKNLTYQFTNAANSYFLLLVILGAFQIFGVDLPGMAAVPLIVIVCITAAKDAFEDYSRKRLDSELNNSPIHMLVGINNENVEKDAVSAWRRFKKACSHSLDAAGASVKRAAIRTFGSKRRKQELVIWEAERQDLSLRRISTVHSQRSAGQVEVLSGPISPNERMSTSLRNHHRFCPESILNPELQLKNAPHSSKFKNRRWKDIVVGDIVRVRNDEEVPADMVILATSDQDDHCYIETKNLDGETNLKTKAPVEAGVTASLRSSSDFANTKFWIECDAPNPNLYTFHGLLHYEKYNKDGKLEKEDEKEVISNDNILLRGCMLRNTKWAVGLVIYTGEETKIMLNSGITPTKTSRISRELNLSVYINFALLFVLCFVSGLINGLFYRSSENSRVFFEFAPYAPTAAANGVVAFFVALIIYQSLVPISLYISVEIIKTLQAFFIFSDIKMYYAKLDFPCTPKAWNISDDLGQIEYIFSDKTGTLTQNVMEFKKCTIGGKSYGLAYTEAQQGMDMRDGIDVVKELSKWKLRIEKDREAMVSAIQQHTQNSQFRELNLKFVSSEFVNDMESNDAQLHANHAFMMALALCHTVVTEMSPDDAELRDFKAESPDEAALVAAARDLGFVFRDRVRKQLLIDVYGKAEEFEMLDIIQFTSQRKCMSCIIRDPTGRILVISKGADNVIFQRLDPKKNSDEVIKRTALHLEQYAKEGLRTLCIAQREISQAQYDDWRKRYKEAATSNSASTDSLLESLNDEMERDLVLLGGTAIEDRLQDGVPVSISTLAEAGVKMWVLTGDRIETAINIGFSCNMLDNHMKLLVVRPPDDNLKDFAHVDSLVTKYLQEEFGMLVDGTDANSVDKLIAAAREDHLAPSPNYGVVIDGAALSLVFEDDTKEANVKLKEKFLLLGKQCKSVICCRVSPSQKAEVVRLVKNGLGVMTLAIGDGANDVAMIQAANVGVGIAGEEGRQAVMSSDYALGQFRFLSRLLLVHGRWSYKRLAEMVPCFFYKNVVFTLTCFWYGIYTDFDGSYLYEYTYLMFYNLAFTSLTVIFLAVLDQDVSDTVSMLVPQLYRSGILGLEWSQYKFVWYMLDGVYQSVIAIFFPYLIYYKGFLNMQGLPADHRFWMGVVCCIVCVSACNIYILLQQYRWDWLSLVIYALLILVVFFWTGVWSAAVRVGQFYKAAPQIFGSTSIWACMIMAIVVCILPRFTYDFLKRNFKPRDIDIIRERARDGAYSKYPDGYDPTNPEDVERHQLLERILEKDPKLLEKFESDIESQADQKLDASPTKNPLKLTIGSIKRLVSHRHLHKHAPKFTINEQFRKPIGLDELREEMARCGEFGGSAADSLRRVSTSHELPGLTQADTLISYHTKRSAELSSQARI